MYVDKIMFNGNVKFIKTVYFYTMSLTLYSNDTFTNSPQLRFYNYQVL